MPPLCIFPNNRENLIRVPACKKHNNDRSGLDTLFLQFLGVAAGQGDTSLWTATLKSLRRTRRDRILVNRASIGRNGSHVVPMEAAPFQSAIKFIVQGLFWYETHTSLGLDVPISVEIVQLINPIPFLQLLKWRSVGQRQFIYAYGIADDDPKSSIWYMQFHGKVTIQALTGSVAE